MTRLKNLFSTFLGIIFVVWLFQAFYTPLENLFIKNTLQSYVYGFVTIVVAGHFLTKLLPSFVKTNTNIKDGVKKQGGCSSCKRKK